MGLLKTVFDFMARLPIVDPHGDYEADLLLAGKKPVGLFTDIIFPDDVIELDSPVMNQIRKDIPILDGAVARGEPLKCSFEATDGRRNLYKYNFYAQTSHKNEMQEVANLHKMYRQVVGVDSEESAAGGITQKDSGKYFGYTKADIRLFHGGGYEALPLPIRFALKATHEFRVKCRVATMLDVSPFDLDRQTYPFPLHCGQVIVLLDVTISLDAPPLGCVYSSTSTLFPWQRVQTCIGWPLGPLGGFSPMF